MVISLIENKEMFIHHYQWIKEIKLFDMTPEVCLSRCLSGEYWGFLGSINDTDVGIVIGKTYGSMAFIIGLWAKNNLKPFLSEFWGVLKRAGFETVRASSILPIEAYQRLTGMDKLWTVYERQL